MTWQIRDVPETPSGNVDEVVGNAAQSAGKRSGQDTNSQLVVTLTSTEQLMMFGEILVVMTVGRTGMLFSVLQSIREPPPHPNKE